MSKRIFLVTVAVILLLVCVKAPLAQQNNKDAQELREAIKDAEELLSKNRGTLRPNREWYNYLPPCPCNVREINLMDWEEESDNVFREFFGASLSHFHPGAASSYRSIRTYIAPQGDNISKGHGQQCTYDKNGNLLPPSAPGAGTPDFYSPSYISVKGHHYFTDVKPWEILGYEIYNKYWKPSSGCYSSFNVLVGQRWDLFNDTASHKLNMVFASQLERKGFIDTVLDVRVGERISFNAVGQVTWGMEGSTCGAEGSNKYAENALGFIFAPPLIGKARNLSGQEVAVGAGALIGIITNGQSIQDIFYIGRGGTYKANSNGRLWVGINDGYVDNNRGYFDVQIQKIY